MTYIYCLYRLFSRLINKKPKNIYIDLIWFTFFCVLDIIMTIFLAYTFFLLKAYGYI